VWRRRPTRALEDISHGGSTGPLGALR
jgi:hypothetical protein